MSFTGAARRLLRTLSLSPSAATTVDLQRAEWDECPAMGADATTGADDSTSFELELWPISSSISRRPSAPNSSDCYHQHRHHYDGFVGDNDDDDQCHFASNRTRGRSKQKEVVAANTDELYTHREALVTYTKTIPSPSFSPYRPLSRADSFASIASSSTQSSTSALDGRSIDTPIGIRNRRSASGSSIGTWSEEPTARRQRASSNAFSTSAKGRPNHQASELCWREYWG
ncbi:hypothetical protein F5Y19DRAFT_187954 [Xylariaceae sp. FL1651]|nr:hypothetical protein F5Y19DRAFT_187954 [Xylariaceae sp. FL1651]